MENTKHIVVLLGTARTGCNSRRVALGVQRALEGRGHTVTFVDVADHLIGRTIEPGVAHSDADRWRQVASHADGFVFVVPEYNHSYPGEFKILIDSAYSEYARKPVGIVAVSSGSYGGTRLVELLRLLIGGIGAVAVPVTLNVAHVMAAFDEYGTITDERVSRRTADFADELDWFLSRMRS